jgi:hypothetical protein
MSDSWNVTDLPEDNFGGAFEEKTINLEEPNELEEDEDEEHIITMLGGKHPKFEIISGKQEEKEVEAEESTTESSSNSDTETSEGETSEESSDEEHEKPEKTSKNLEEQKEEIEESEEFGKEQEEQEEQEELEEEAEEEQEFGEERHEPDEQEEAEGGDDDLLILDDAYKNDPAISIYGSGSSDSGSDGSLYVDNLLQLGKDLITIA